MYNECSPIDVPAMNKKNNRYRKNVLKYYSATTISAIRLRTLSVDFLRKMQIQDIQTKTNVYINQTVACE